MTDDREAAAARLATADPHSGALDEILQTPIYLIGTVEEMADQILRCRERYGITYFTVHQPFLDSFAPVIDRVRSLDA